MALLGRFKKSNVNTLQGAKAPKLSRKAKKAARQAQVLEAQAATMHAQPAYATDPRMMEPRMGDLTVGDYANGMPRIRLGEFFSSFARQLKWLIPLFLLGTLGAWYLTKDFKRTYSGEGRVLVQLGDEYVYDSVTSKQAQGLQLTPDHIVQNEVGIMKNADIIEQVVGEMTSPGSFGPQRFAKEAFAKINSARGPVAEQNAWVDLYKEVEQNFAVMPKPKSSIVDLVYKHEDPQVAVETLNMFITKYMDARKRLFVEGSSDIISERRRETEQQLDKNERAIQAFLRKNGVSDFTSERTGVTKRTEDLRTQLNTLRGQMSETERALATVEQQLRSTPETIDLYVDDRASQRIAQAELELKQLLAKYLPGSPPVAQKQNELNHLKSLIAAQGGKATGGRRVGPNVVYQGILTNRNTLQSRADSYREKEYTLQRQLDAADNKVRRLQDISPVYQNLLRKRETLDGRLKNYTAREQEAMINQNQAESDSENVRVISWATRPRKGRNMRLVMFALASAGWGFTLFVLAMMKVFLDPKLYATPPTLRATGRRHMDDDRRQTPYQEPYQTPYQEPYQAPAEATPYSAPYAPEVPESVPMPAAAFAATPYVATAAAPQYGAASQPAPQYGEQAVYADPYAQQAVYADPYAQPQQAYAPSGYGNAAEDLYANPYLQPQQAQVPQAQMQTLQDDVLVLGTVPTES